MMIHLHDPQRGHSRRIN